MFAPVKPSVIARERTSILERTFKNSLNISTIIERAAEKGLLIEVKTKKLLITSAIKPYIAVDTMVHYIIKMQTLQVRVY